MQIPFGDPHCSIVSIDLTSKFCSVASCSASNLQVMFDRRSSRMMELTSILFFILTCSSSRGCRYSGALPALTSASFFSICVTLSRYSLKCMITALGENNFLKRQWLQRRGVITGFLRWDKAYVVGIICPPGCDRVNYLAKNWGAPAPPLATGLGYSFIIVLNWSPII